MRFVNEELLDKELDDASPIAIAFVDLWDLGDPITPEQLHRRKLFRAKLLEARRRYSPECRFVGVLVDENPALGVRWMPPLKGVVTCPWLVVVRRLDKNEVEFVYDNFGATILQAVKEATKP